MTSTDGGGRKQIRAVASGHGNVGNAHGGAAVAQSSPASSWSFRRSQGCCCKDGRLPFVTARQRRPTRLSHHFDGPLATIRYRKARVEFAKASTAAQIGSHLIAFAPEAITVGSIMVPPTFWHGRSTGGTAMQLAAFQTGATVKWCRR